MERYEGNVSGEESPFSLYPDILRAYPGLILLRDNQIKRLISGIYANNRMVQQALEALIQGKPVHRIKPTTVSMIVELVERLLNELRQVSHSSFLEHFLDTETALSSHNQDRLLRLSDD